MAKKTEKPVETPASVAEVVKPVKAVVASKITPAQRQNIRIALLSAGVVANDAHIEHVIDHIVRAIYKG